MKTIKNLFLIVGLTGLMFSCTKSEQPDFDISGMSANNLNSYSMINNEIFIVEPGGIVQTGGFHHLVEIAAHAVQAVEEPPGRAKPQGGVVPGERRQLAAVGAFIQGK